MSPKEEGHSASESSEEVEPGNFEVEAILDVNEEVNDDGTKELFYFIKWKGYSYSENTWEPEDNLNCPELMRRFKEAQKLKQKVEAERKGEKSGQSSRKEAQIKKPKLNKTKTTTASSTLALSQKSTKIAPKAQPACSIEVLSEGVPSNLAKPSGIAKFFKSSSSSMEESSDKLWPKQMLIVDGSDSSSDSHGSCSETEADEEDSTDLDEETQFEEAIKKFKKMLARVPGPPIDIKNEIDLCPPPADFFYISEVIYGQGVAKPDASFLVGCACYVADEESMQRKGCCFEGDCLCLANSGQPVAYDKDGLLLPGITVIYECNSRCCCTIFSQPCRNRVIQQGRKVSLTIFRHGGPRGWGVRANHDIPRGTFIDVYLGEVITTKEANSRFKRAQATKKHIEASYLFDLDFNYEAGQESEFTLDAYRYGNVTHFINHSCDPNLRVCPCFTESQDARMHSLAFFACKDISRGEELTFDYLGSNSLTNVAKGKAGKGGDQLACLCGSGKCRKFIYK